MSASLLKRCTKCVEVRTGDCFYRNTRRIDGLSSWCKECEKTHRAEYHARNREKICDRKRAKWAENDDSRREARNEAARRAHKDEPERFRLAWRTYARKRRSSCPDVRLRDRISRLILRCLSSGKGGRNSEALLGYTMSELRVHLECQFLKGMSWENMGAWHIDHIIPLASFTIADFDDPELQRAWGLANLRPLWAKDNIRKSDKRETLL